MNFTSTCDDTADAAPFDIAGEVTYTRQMTHYDETAVLQMTADHLQKRLGKIIAAADTIDSETPAMTAGFIRQNLDARAEVVRKQLSELAELGIIPTPIPTESVLSSN
jgi:hypothetical protein